MAFQRLDNLDELRVGLHVKLECSWWAHPFATSQFKIASARDIEAIRAIRKLKLYYDPDLSDSLSSEPIDDPLDVDQQDAEFESIEDTEEDFFTPETVDSDDTEDIDAIPAIAFEELRRSRKRLYQDHRTNLKKVEDAYWRVLGRTKDIFKRIGTGHHEAVKSAGQLVSNVAGVLSHEQATMTLMDIVSSTGMAEGRSSHALNVCILSSIVGREMGLDPEELHVLGLGALFHDIGKRSLPMKVKFHDTGITMQADPASSRLHPEKGRDMMEKLKHFPAESIDIIFHHHERLDGSGYPEGLTGDQISLLTQIVMVTDEYDELCNASEFQKVLTPHEALVHFYRYIDSNQNKYSQEVIMALIKSLTVFPPGSLVELNDGTIGQVISVNMKTPTKPLLLSSHFEGTRQEAMMVDLVQEPYLSITRSLHPSEVSPKVLEFLSPRRASIFIHPGQPVAPMVGKVAKIASGSSLNLAF